MIGPHPGDPDRGSDRRSWGSLDVRSGHDPGSNLADLAIVPLLILDDLGRRTLPHTAAEDLLDVIRRRDESASTRLTSNRPVDDWGKRLGDTAAVTALLDRLLHHAHVLTCGPRSWRTTVHADVRPEEGPKYNLLTFPSDHDVAEIRASAAWTGRQIKKRPRRRP